MEFNPMSLKEKRILVTGASSGIGKLTAITLSKLGAKTILVARNNERLKETLQSLTGEGHCSYSFDLTNVDEIPGFMKEVAQEHGLISGLFHAAGIETTLSVNMLKRKYIDRVFGVNLLPALLLTRGLIHKSVREANQVSIVFMSSVASLTGTSGRSIYSASKAALDGAMRSLACELSSSNIRVNSVAAGAVQTEMLDNVAKSLPKESMDEFRSQHLLGFGEPADVANAVAFLLSDAARWITGTVMVVDGGYCCH